MAIFSDELKRLVDQFHQQFDTVTRADYNETLIRVDYINPMMRALGWDIDNRQGYAEQYREVVHEDRVKVAGQSKAPDYSFRIGGTRKFFLEAKKPAVKIRDNPEPAFQIRRYGWSAKLAVSLLTDFQEFAIYDTRKRPVSTDKARESRREYLTYDQYESKWEFISGTFSKDAVLRGAFDRYCESTRARGAEPVDEAFLDEIEGWREILAKNIALRNGDLDEPALNFAVQRIIDRIIFLRIAEDRGTEKTDDLKLLLKGDGVYDRLKERFRLADARYNSGLFHFKNEGGRDESPDTLTPALAIDDKPLREIVSDLYLPKSPYEFSYLSADILGSVYERFLGKVITRVGVTRVKVEDKPEVRKAGGVYYTPVYIVDYIVKNTVGTLLEGKTPQQAEAIKVLDPACGSGSFLIGAYQFLLDWYLKQYAPSDEVARTHAKGKRPKLREAVVKRPAPEDKDHFVPGWALTIDERKRILLAHIHGVDLDAQAVEVTKLNLLLKCLEGETAATLGFDNALFRDRALPDLGHNVLCGNSLIGTDIIGTDAWKTMNEEERGKMNPFDYGRAFPNVVNGEFHALIGNPPYRREQNFKEVLQQIALSPWGKQHRVARMDLWYYFVHKGLELVRPDGYLSFIVNSYWTGSAGARVVATAMRDQSHVEEIFSLGKLKVFEDVAGQHMIFRLRKAGTSDATPTKLKLVDSAISTDAQRAVNALDGVRQFEKRRDELFRGDKVDLQPVDSGFISRVFKGSQLQTLGELRQGIVANPPTVSGRSNEKFGNKWRTGEAVFVLQPEELAALQLPERERDLVRPFHDVCDLARYFVAPLTSHFIIYASRETWPSGGDYPTIKAHLERFRPIMAARRETQEGKVPWFHLHWPREQKVWEGPKILCVRMAERPTFAVAREPAYVPYNVIVFAPEQAHTGQVESICGILNSRLMWKWFIHHAKQRGIGLEINNDSLEIAPVVTRESLLGPAIKLFDDIGQFAVSMQSLHARLASEQLPQRREQIQREIEATDRQIDQLVYQLYGLTDDEIRIVEAATA